jgi:membrane protein implicated in regulation of membrane protease activity
MTGRHFKEPGGGGALAVAGVGFLAVVCCAAFPLLAAVLGSVALGSVLGVGAGILAAMVLLALVLVRARRRRQARELPSRDPFGPAGADAVEPAAERVR